jgi:hypothetical protein
MIGVDWVDKRRVVYEYQWFVFFRPVCLVVKLDAIVGFKGRHCEVNFLSVRLYSNAGAVVSFIID